MVLHTVCECMLLFCGSYLNGIQDRFYHSSLPQSFWSWSRKYYVLDHEQANRREYSVCRFLVYFTFIYALFYLKKHKNFTVHDHIYFWLQNNRKRIKRSFSSVFGSKYDSRVIYTWRKWRYLTLIRRGISHG